MVRSSVAKRGKKQSKTKSEGAHKTVARNRKARYQYAILERFEAGIELKGAEVKSLREGQASLEGSFARPQGSEIFLLDAQINPYANAAPGGLDPRRPRKLLLRRREINRLAAQVRQKGFTLVPLSIYFARGLAKVELALCTGKTHGDKRQAMKEAEVKRRLAAARVNTRKGR